MSLYGLLVFFIVVISLSECGPHGNITYHPRRVLKFQNTSTTVRTPTGGWASDKNTTSRIGTGEEQFVFPVDATPPTVITNRAQFKPTVKNHAPPCADGLTFCEKVDGYPGNILEHTFDNALPLFKDLQGTDELRLPPIIPRIGIDTTHELSLCPSREEIVFPKAAKTIDDKWLFVVNTKSFVQGVRVEKCLRTSEGSEKSCVFNDLFPKGYKAVCKQKYIYRKLVALGDEGKPIKESFLLPSCCSCKLITVGAMIRPGIMMKPLPMTAN